MLHLAFDTCCPHGRFALADDGRPLAYRPLNVSGSYADALLPVVQDMLAGAGRTLQEVGGIGVIQGPGSFTGVRIGVATAKGLAYGLGCGLTAVSSLAAMAAALLAEHPQARLAVPVLDARRGEVYAGIFARRPGWVQELAAPGPAAPAVWWERVLQAVPDPDEAVIGGEGAALLLASEAGLRPQLAERGTPRRRLWSLAHPRTAEALAAAMGDPRADLPRVHPFALVPLYMRASDAEIKRRLDLTPRRPAGEILSHGDDPEAG